MMQSKKVLVVKYTDQRRVDLGLSKQCLRAYVDNIIIIIIIFIIYKAQYPNMLKALYTKI